jgi:hypothetical protein
MTPILPPITRIEPPEVSSRSDPAGTQSLASRGGGEKILLEVKRQTSTHWYEVLSVDGKIVVGENLQWLPGGRERAFEFEGRFSYFHQTPADSPEFVRRVSVADDLVVQHDCGTAGGRAAATRKASLDRDRRDSSIAITDRYFGHGATFARFSFRGETALA